MPIGPAVHPQTDTDTDIDTDTDTDTDTHTHNVTILASYEQATVH
jgi:hypothetical protein